MRDAEKTRTEDLTLGLTTAVYYTVVLAAFVIGLYGLFSLFWLAASAVEHNARITGSVF